jgi:hypothetical protein
VVVLGVAEAPDLTRMAAVRATVARCDPFLPPGPETMTMRARLDAQEQILLRERDDRAEHEALKDLTFFIDWDRRIAGLRWGAPAASWLGDGDFSRKWAEGADAGSDCRCSLDPEEPCRVFEAEGPHGGFEVVARFYQGTLAGLDVCQVYTGGDLSAIVKFFARRYVRAHSKAQASAFLAGGGNVPAARALIFGQAPGPVITLERSADSCSVRYRSGKLLSQREADEKAAREKQEQEAQRTRGERIRKGWAPGDCVVWDCRGGCAYRGTVKKTSSERYQVSVTQAEDDPRSVGNDLWVPARELFDCP